MRISDWSSDVCSSDLLAAKVAAVHAAPPAHADLKPQLAGAITQDQFHLGIALKAFRHARHFLARALPARHVAGAIEAVALLFEALPAFHEPIGAQVRIGPHARPLGHRPDQPAAAPPRRLAQPSEIALHPPCQLTPGSRPALVPRLCLSPERHLLKVKEQGPR